MRWPFARKESSDAARRERLDEIERGVTQSLRSLATAFTQLANAIEQRRLSRAGYEKQERFLQRTDGAATDPVAGSKK
jgi:hypothetical protein